MEKSDWDIRFDDWMTANFILLFSAGAAWWLALIEKWFGSSRLSDYLTVWGLIVFLMWCVTLAIAVHYAEKAHKVRMARWLDE